MSADNPFTVLPTGQSRVCIHPCLTPRWQGQVWG